MSNTSATGGILDPITDGVPAPEPEDNAFLDFLQPVIAAITGIDGAFVRPAFQEQPGNLPPRRTDWLAYGITSRRPDQCGYEAHDDAGRTALIRYEDADLLCTFYGPHSEGRATRLRDGLLIGQNRDILTAGGVGIRGFAGPVRVPVLLKELWLYRTDLTITLRRQIRSLYPILNIVKGVGLVITDHPARTTPFAAGV